MLRYLFRKNKIVNSAERSMQENSLIIAALLIITPKWKHPICTPTRKGINKVWEIYAIIRYKKKEGAIDKKKKKRPNIRKSRLHELRESTYCVVHL